MQSALGWESGLQLRSVWAMRWEWVRWVNETRSPATRAVRIEKTVSKLAGKHRRPCCFNLAACTDPELSRSARLAVPAPGHHDGERKRTRKAGRPP